MTNPYFAPVGAGWARAAGILLLAAAAGLTVFLGRQILQLLVGESARHAFNSSSLVFGLILLALCLMCWQAGYRLAFRRPGPSRSLFSRPAWFAIGTGLAVISVLMASVIVSVRRPTLLDLQVVLSLGGFGIWCLVLALRRRRSDPPVSAGRRVSPWLARRRTGRTR